MMRVKISQKLDYACRALLHLTRKYDGSTVLRSDDIAKVEAIPTSFLAQILHQLKKGEIVTSRRGKSGGWLLARAPAEITLLEVIEAVDPHVLGAASGKKEGQSAEILAGFWASLRDDLRQSLAESTLESIAATEAPPMYFI